MVTEIWQLEHGGESAVELGQNKIRALRQYLQGWAKDTVGHLKHEKHQIMNVLDGLDKKAEKTMLTPNEITLKHYLNERLTHILRE
jgi:hypothetical protein